MKKPQISKMGECIVLRQNTEHGDQTIQLSRDDAERLMNDLEEFTHRGATGSGDVPVKDAEEERQDAFGRL